MQRMLKGTTPLYSTLIISHLLLALGPPVFIPFIEPQGLQEFREWREGAGHPAQDQNVEGPGRKASEEGEWDLWDHT
jgi:hypothetical protein